MTIPKPNLPRAGLNLGLVLRVLWPALLVWLVATAALAAAGYPAVLCVTPLAWVLAVYTRRVCGLGAAVAWWKRAWPAVCWVWGRAGCLGC